MSNTTIDTLIIILPWVITALLVGILGTIVFNALRRVRFAGVTPGSDWPGGSSDWDSSFTSARKELETAGSAEVNKLVSVHLPR